MVSAPRNPVMKKRRMDGLKIWVFSERAKAMPIKKQPAMLAKRVPHGKRVPIYFAAVTEKTYLKRAPMLPPAIIRIILLKIFTMIF